VSNTRLLMLGALLGLLACGQAKQGYSVEEPHAVFKIQGRLQGYLTRETVYFDLLRGPTHPGHGGMFDAHTGDFEIPDVAPGEYRLRVSQGKKRGEAKVSIRTADVTGIAIALMASSTVRGVTHSVGGRAGVIRYPNPCNVNLSQDWPPSPEAVYVPKWQQDGQFTLDDVLPGEYQVHFLCFGAYVQSASFGGADLLRNPVVTIPADAPLPSLEIDYTPGGGALQARFTVIPFNAVLLVPDFPTSNGPELQRVNRILGIVPDRDMFQFSNLTPGDYTIYTFPKFEDVEFRNPEFLRALSGGTRVHIEDGEIAELTITGSSSMPTVRQVPLN
jgi:hypothetical protein